MWLVSCNRQGMLTEGHALDGKCKFISSFFALPDLLDYLIYTGNAMFIVLIITKMMGDANLH